MKIIIEYFLLAMFITLAILHIFNSPPKIIVKHPNNISKLTFTKSTFANNIINPNEPHEVCSINKWTKT